MAQLQLFVKDGTNVLELRKLRNVLAVRGSADEYPQAADVTLKELKEVGGAVVPNTVDLDMPQVEGTTGKKTIYRVKLDHTLVFDTAKQYRGKILATVPGGVRPFYVDVKIIEG